MKVKIVSSETSIEIAMTERFNLSAFMPYRLAAIAERVSRRLSVEYEREFGLSVAEWRVLVHVQRAGPVSVRDIHDYANLEKPRVSRAVARLEAAGLLRKSSSDGDARLVSISLTEDGKTALARLLPVVSEIEATLMAELTEDEAATFFRAIEKLHAALDKDPEAKLRSKMDHDI